MAPRFRRKDKSVEAGFRRIALAEIDEAIAIIDAPERAGVDKVHKVRRQLKALRGLLRLVRPAFPRFERENVAFRDMARTLSGSRDAKVMLDTFDKITRVTGRPSLPRGLAMARDRLSAVAADDGDGHAQLDLARAGLRRARRRVAGWTLRAEGWEAVAGGLARTYDQAREAMREAMASGNAAASHEWRKDVKYHGAQLRLLGTMATPALRARRKQVGRLGDLLGERHDIDMLLDTVARAPARFGDIVTVTQLAGLARLRSARLDRQTSRLGEQLFSEKWAKLGRPWRVAWRDWSKGNA